MDTKLTWWALAGLLAGCGGGTSAGMGGMAVAPSASYDAPAAEVATPAVPEGGDGTSGGLGDAPSDGAGSGSSGPAAGGSGNLVAAVVGRGGNQTAEAASATAALERAENAPLLVYTATIGMEVDTVQMASTIDQIVENAIAAGGYLAGRTDRNVTVRIPSRAFRAGLAAIEQLGTITSRNVTADDVSAEFRDLEVRLVNLRALRARFEQLLDRAGNMEEILRVETELERLAREIDGMEGRIRFLRSQIAFSILTVNLTAPPPPPVIVVAPPPAPLPVVPPPPRRALSLPIPWLAQIGVEALIDLRDPS